MPNKQQLQECIDQCTAAANRLRITTNHVVDAAVRDRLTLAAHEVEQCIRDCVHVMQTT